MARVGDRYTQSLRETEGRPGPGPIILLRRTLLLHLDGSRPLSTAEISGTERADLKEMSMTSSAHQHRTTARKFIFREIQHVDG